jgi:dihydroneopterin aldolase
MDITYISGLRANAVIGVYDWERDIRQPLVLDLELGCDTTRAAASDDLTLAVDYAAISQCVLEFVQASEYLLIETLAEAVARMLIEDMNVQWLRLRLGKPGAVPEADDVGVIIERGSWV